MARRGCKRRLDAESLYWQPQPPGASVLPAACDGPPSPRQAEEADIFGERKRLSIRRQLGF